MSTYFFVLLKLFVLYHNLNVIITPSSNKYDDLAQNSQKQTVFTDITISFACRIVKFFLGLKYLIKMEFKLG